MCHWQGVKIKICQPTPSKKKRKKRLQNTPTIYQTMYTFLVTMPRVKTTHTFRSLLFATHLTPVDIDKRESWLHHLWNSSCRRQRWSSLVFARTHKNTPLDCAAESAPAHKSTLIVTGCFKRYRSENSTWWIKKKITHQPEHIIPVICNTNNNKNLVFYTQSTVAVISGHFFFKHMHIICTPVVREGEIGGGGGVGG